MIASVFDNRLAKRQSLRRGLLLALSFVLLFVPHELLAQPVDDAGKLIQAMQEAVTKAVASAEKSVVAIARIPKDQTAAGFQVPSISRLGIGSRIDEPLPTDVDYVPNHYAAGVVIDESGLIVTTYHVVGDIKESDYYVWSQRRPFRAQVVAADGWFDLAVLKIEAADLRAMPLGDAKSIEKGKFVIALGNPQAIGHDGEASGAWGIVSNLRRRAPRVPERSADAAGRETLHHYGTLIQTDLKLDLGFSGGALVNLDGEMIGLLTAYSGGAAKPSTAGFAIPVDQYFKQAVDQLKVGKSPEFGFLGVGPQPLDLRLRQQGHFGTLVETVLPSTPASRADLRPGDVITHADGQPLNDDDDLIRVIGSVPPEQVVRLTVFRGDLARDDGEVLQKEVTVSKKLVNSLRPAFSTVPPPTWRGMVVDYSSAASREALVANQLPPEGCVYVAEVAQDSPVWKSGIRAGSFILRAAGKEVATPREFFAALEGVAGNVPLQVLAGRNVVTTHTVSP